MSKVKALGKLFPFVYSGGGYFRHKDVPVGTSAEILHGMDAIKYIYEKMQDHDKEAEPVASKEAYDKLCPTCQSVMCTDSCGSWCFNCGSTAKPIEKAVGPSVSPAVAMTDEDRHAGWVPVSEYTPPTTAKRIGCVHCRSIAFPLCANCRQLDAKRASWKR